jgi:hypothetical protein
MIATGLLPQISLIAQIPDLIFACGEYFADYCPLNSERTPNLQLHSACCKLSLRLGSERYFGLLQTQLHLTTATATADCLLPTD